MTDEERKLCVSFYKVSKYDMSTDAPMETSQAIVTMWEGFRDRELAVADLTTALDTLQHRFNVLAKAFEQITAASILKIEGDAVSGSKQ